MSWTPPPLPGENEDPWFAKRQAWDRSAENAINARVEITKGTLANGVDLDTLRTFEDAGSHQIISTNTHPNLPYSVSAAAELNVRVANQNNATTQTLTDVFNGEVRQAVRKLINPSGNDGEPLWSYWMPLSNKNDSSGPKQILDLARRDGWREVYDPSNLSTVNLNSEGRVTTLRGGLGNLPALNAPEGFAPEFAAQEFGQLSGMKFDGNHLLRNVFGSTMANPLVIMAIGRFTGEKTESGFSTLLDGNAGERKNIIVRSTANGMPYSTALHEGTEFFSDHEAHLFRLHAFTTRDELSVDGQHASVRSEQSGGLSGIVLGSTPGIANFWKGFIGTILIYNGNPSRDKIDRMQSLIFSLMGKEKGPHILKPTTTAMSITESGRVALTHGDVDMVWPTGIQSITKLMTILTAKNFVSDAEFRTLTEPYEVGDDGGGSVFSPGDTMTLFDWAWASIGPSFNASNEVIARFAGRRIPGSGDPKEKFRAEMNRISREWYGGEQFTNFSYAATLSARETIDLLRRSYQDPTMRELLGTARKTVQMTGPNPRSYTWGHTIPSNCPYPFPTWVAGKTGGGQGDGHVVTMWRNPLDNEVYYTAIMNTPTADGDHRYTELKKAMVASETSGFNHARTPSTQPKRGDGLSQSGLLDVSEMFSAVPSGSDAKVILERQGEWVKLSFQGVIIPENFSGSNLIPVQFRPKTFEYGVLMGDTSSAREIRIRSNGTVNVYGNGPSEVLRGSVMWRTRREWPTTLP